MNMKQAKDYIRRLKKALKEARAQLKSPMQKKTAGAPAGAQKK